MKKKILITGATGFVGRHFRNKMAKNRDFILFPLVRRKIGLPNEIILDLCDGLLGKGINDFPSVDAVVHLGARIGWDGSSRSELFVRGPSNSSCFISWIVSSNRSPTSKTSAS